MLMLVCDVIFFGTFTDKPPNDHAIPTVDSDRSLWRHNFFVRRHRFAGGFLGRVAREL
jgi:hypothetical protein